MPGHYGRSSSSGSSGSSGSKGSPHSGGGGGWSPGVGGKQHQPKAKAKTSTWTPGGGAPTHIPKKKTSTWTPGAGAPTHIPKKKTAPVTAGLGHPFFKNKMIKKAALAKRKFPGYRTGKTGALQAIMNMPKYWSLPSDIRVLIESGEKIPIAHGFESKKVLDFMKKSGLEDIRPQAKFPPTTDAIEAAAKQLMKGNLKDSWKALGQTKGAFTATGPTAKEAFLGGQRYAKPGGVLAELKTGLRGMNLGSAKAVAKGYIDPIHGYVDRGMTGNVQFRGSSGAINKALKLGPASAQVAGKPIAQSVLNKLGARLLPGANIGLGGTAALGHLKAGNYGQAAMAGLSMIPGPVGYAGLAGEMILGAPSMKEQGLGSYTGPMIGRANGGLANLYRHGGFI